MKKGNHNCLPTMITLSIVMLFLSCGVTKMESTWTSNDYPDREYSKIAVVGIGKDLAARNTFEQDAVELLRAQGINAVVGIHMFPPGGKVEIRGPKDYIKIIKENNLDGVLTMALVDSNEKERYQPGETVYIPSYYRVGKYIYRGYRTYSAPGYYTNQKSYLIEAVLYNVKGELFEGKETMVWTGQSSLLEPSSLKSASDTFTKRMVNQLITDMVIMAK
ncbi:hypothetical protein [Flagellimonas eckloniae]|uniref:DUF4136 domain-containing protein n=1 Tax=Flagellimonas eckloniae TaxID=346185 RepID=A0A0Q1CD86_9FLAO|nr:hypothetical protein [Allomuricauda eckloniae]KQC28637.1 hypothetical protein AAY42_01000 [Allomuricauda eckloniae]